MQILLPVDIADALQELLNANGVRACAEPLPRDMDELLPITLVQPIGGGRSVQVLDRHAVRLYTWAVTPGEAIAECCKALAIVKASEGQAVAGVQLYAVTPSAMPYPAPDPAHPDIPRACVTADVFARATVTDL